MMNDLPLHEGKYEIRFRQPTDPFFYYFDYDERSYSVNMDFQHFHSFYEMFILLDDEAYHIIEGQLYPLQRYDIVCLRPALLHKSHYPVGAPKKRLIVNFNYPGQFNDFLPEFGKLLDVFNEQVPIFRFDQKNRHMIFAALNEIFSDDAFSDAIRDLRMHHCFVKVLMSLYEHRSQNLFHVEAGQSSLTDKIYDICAYIHSSFPEQLSLDGLAQRFFISPCYLSHQFKHVTHFSVTEYIQRTRIRNAQQFLIFTDDAVSEIADACGFKSFSQFNRVFHKLCCCSPSHYRKSNRPFIAKER